jgi:hypothetical protein
LIETENQKAKGNMHYGNGREAKNGDKVVLVSSYGSPVPVAGVLYDAVAGNDSCNGRIAVTTANDPMPDLRNVLHIDDIAAAKAEGMIPSTLPIRVADSGTTAA